MSFLNLSGDAVRFAEFNRAVVGHIENDQKVLFWDEDEVDPKSIHQLILTSNNISQLVSISNLFSNVTYLNISFNNLKDVDFLPKMLNLQTLDISNNKLTSVNDISELQNLSVLRCNNNTIEHLEHLKDSINLTQLYIHNNKIDWTQFIFLSTLTKLQVLVKYNNPCEDKSKMNEFVLFLLPSLIVLDAMKVTVIPANFLPASTIAGMNNTTTLSRTLAMQNAQSQLNTTTNIGLGAQTIVTKDTITFLGETQIIKQSNMIDLKVMLTQAKAQCKLTTQQQNIARLKKERLEREGTGSDTPNTQQRRGSTQKVLNSTLKRELSTSSLPSVDSDGMDTDTASTYTQGSRRSNSNNKAKAIKKTTMKPKKTMSATNRNNMKSTTQGTVATDYLASSGELLSSVRTAERNNTEEDVTQGKLNIETTVGTDDRSNTTTTAGSNSANNKHRPLKRLNLRKFNKPHVSAAGPTLSSGNNGSEPQGNVESVSSTVADQHNNAQIIRFHTASSGGINSRSSGGGVGDGKKADDAPVALCIYANNDGYVRWSKNGPQACSLEKGRLFASYKSGAIAMVYDTSIGHGSIMDTRGRCLLVLHGNATAKVLDIKGNTTSEYNKHDCCSVNPGVATVACTGGVSNANSNINNDDSDSQGSAKSHVWEIEGLKMEFTPRLWEVTIKCQNERVICEFSTLHGCKLISEKQESTPQAKKSTLKKVNQQQQQQQLSLPPQHPPQQYKQQQGQGQGQAASKKPTVSGNKNSGSDRTASGMHGNAGGGTGLSQHTSEQIESQHNSLRNDIQSLNLDDMLAGIKGLKFN